MLKKLLILLFLPLILCSCTKNQTEEITFSSWGSITETEIINKVIKEFENNNPNIKINFIHIPQNYFQKLHLLFVAQQEPDVIFINNLYLPIYAEKLIELDIDQNNFYPQTIKAMSYNGKLLAVPRDISNLVFYYNKSIVNNINPNWNFQDFIKIINSIKHYYPTGFERDIFWAQPYILTLGYKDGINFYLDLEGKYAPTPSEVGSSTLTQMFIDGKIALLLSGRWMYPKICEKARFPFGIVTFPGTVNSDASGWAISKNSQHKESAMKFINFLASKEISEYFTKTGLIIPARKDCAYLIKEKAFLDAIEKSEPTIVDKNYKKNQDKINKELFN